MFNFNEDDVKWVTVDPLEQSIIFLKPIEQARLKMNKHTNPLEQMTSDDVKLCIESPTRIDNSVQNKVGKERQIYYKYNSNVPLKYSRAVVDFSGKDYGIVISWSRYSEPVQGDTIYINPRNQL